MRDRLQSPRPAHDRGPARRGPAAVEPVRSLARAIGNRALAQMIARDLVKEKKVKEGTFKLDLKTQSNPGAKSGLRGTVSFKADETAPDSKSIRMVQAAKAVDLGTGKDVVFGGDNAGRNALKTSADAKRGIEEGWMVDVKPSAITPRTAKSDKAVSPYYRDYWPNVASSQDGSKAGKTVTVASLWDYPGSTGNIGFSFETAAKATDTGHVYGSVRWGFQITDAAKGKIENERWDVSDTTAASTDEALKVFDEVYRNPGASTAPTT